MVTSRARPLPPDERRAALIAAVLPLVRRYGTGVSTRQIAEASGVAEGTIFRAFSDKEALIQAAVCAATDPEPVIAQLVQVDQSLPLRPRMVEAVRILQRWLIDVITLMMAVHLHGPPAEHPQRHANNERINAAVTPLLAIDHEAFRVPLSEVTRMLRLLLFAGSHPLINYDRLLTPEEIVGLLLDGVLKHEGTH